MRSAVEMPLLVSEPEAAILDSQSKIAHWLYNKLLYSLRSRQRKELLTCAEAELHNL